MHGRRAAGSAAQPLPLGARVLRGGLDVRARLGRVPRQRPAAAEAAAPLQLLRLDEATEGLAPLVRREIWRCLNQLKEEGISILVVDKNVSDLARIADMHYVIEKGRIVWEGTSPELLEQKDFLGNKLGV